MQMPVIFNEKSHYSPIMPKSKSSQNLLPNYFFTYKRNNPPPEFRGASHIGLT